MDFTPYLRPTAHLDFEHPAIQSLAREVSAGTDDRREQAIRLFLRVRDDVRYDPYSISLEPGRFAASVTLEARRGFCVTKAILYAAGLRALGIPSRLGFADVKNHLATQRLLEIMQTDVFAYHGYTEVFLGEQWVKATPAFNATLCEKFGTPPLDFDGVHDAVLQPATRDGSKFMEYLKDRGAFADFDLNDMLKAWREVYPHMFVGLPETPTGDFEMEAEREKR